MIKYLGSKKKLLENIHGVVSSFNDVHSIGDLFSGTSRVGHFLKSNGYRVEANDHNAYASTLATCYVQADREDWLEHAESLVAELNQLPGSPGYFTETFCETARYFQPKNGERIDAIRERIETLDLEPELRAVMLVSLMEAADRVDSTTGIQMAYLKSWAPRAFNDLELRVPAILSRSKFGKSKATQLEAIDAVGRMDVDLMYVDPPYNQHSYLANYHVWESLVLWDKPEVYGIANKRIDVRERKSSFNSKREFRESFEQLLSGIRCPISVISFNNEGYISQTEMESLLETMHGGEAKFMTFAHDYQRYVGAKIGIHNKQGEKVGSVSHTENQELIYVVTRPEVSLGRLEQYATA